MVTIKQSILRVLVAALIWGSAACGNELLAKDQFEAEARAYWAFQKVARPKPPTVQQAQWVRNPIDAFVLAELEAKQILPSPPADKITLLRRAYLDLIGLPPTPKDEIGRASCRERVYH